MGLELFVILALFGIPASMTWGVLAGLLMVIPLFGAALSFLPPLLAILLTDPSQVLLVLIPIAILQIVIANVLVPRIVGNALGLHPMVTIISLLIGIKLAGFWGAFFAMPIAGILSSLGAYLRQRGPLTPDITASVVKDDRASAAGGFDSDSGL